MRLLNVKTLELEEFFDEDTPAYAILSHRWVAREITFKQYVEKSYNNGPALDKIRNSCAVAEKRCLEWIWIDTICIDKSSSAELSEAINSMWHFYHDAVECYAFLADVSYSESLDGSFSQSAWFKRGWTLQELLAPARVLFYDCSWHMFGTKVDLAEDISEITGIGSSFLRDPSSLSKASVAMRMSRAAKRKTTRIEDTAYSLLGLFDVNMPLLYGEREKAFLRLQLQIVANSDDESIFAWKDEDRSHSGLLASWPADFRDSGDIHRIHVNPEFRLP